MDKKIKFEEAVKRLEEIVEELETGEFDLDKAIQIFEEGLALSKFCKKRLEEAEQKIEIIKKQNLDGIADEENGGEKRGAKEHYKKEKTDIGLLLKNRENDE